MAAPKVATTEIGKLDKVDTAGGYDQVIPTGRGTSHYLLEGRLHREDGPAVVWDDGTELFYLEGKLHGNPAVAHPDGRKDVYDHGAAVSLEPLLVPIRVAEDLPAV